MAARKQRRSALGTNPFSAADAYLETPEDPPPPPRRKSRSSKPRRSRGAKPARTNGEDEGKPRSSKKVRGTFQMTEDLLQTARNTVVALSGPPHRLTLAGLVEQALTREIQRLEKQHNDGDPFPSIDEPLRQGRPIGS